MAFTHLHVHSEYSPKDSIAKIPAIVRKVAADGQGAVAISDHGSLGGIWALREATKGAGIKPIPAFEAYLALCPRPGMTRMDRHEEEVPRDEADTDGLGTTKGTKTRRYHHLTVLARTREGWGNLMQLHNRGYEAQWYGTPFIDYNMLATKAAAKRLRISALEAFGDGIAVLTGCLGGPVQAPLSLAIRADREAAERDAREKSRRLAAAEHTARAAELERSAGEYAEQSLRLKSQAEKFSQQGREDMAEGPARAALEQDGLAQAAHGEAAAQNHSAQAAEQDADSQAGLAEVARETAAARRSEARTNLQRLIEALGKENVHVEVMYHGIDREREILAELFALADEFGLLCVATGDSHCVEPHEEYAQDAFLAIGSKKLLDDPHRWRFNGQGYHVKSEAEMLEVFPEGDPLRTPWQQACANTQIVADAVDADVIPEPEMRLPQFPAPEGMTSAELFTDLVWKGAKGTAFKPGKYSHLMVDGELPVHVTERIEHELSVVLEKGFADYFLILWDVVAWCGTDYTADDWIAMQKGMALPADRERKEPISTGPGRGSAAGSACSYCLDIVGVDPIEAGLLFERFLAPDRKGMPDIDTDFEYLRRGEVQEFLRRRWGRDNVALIGTYNPFLSKGAIKAAARTLGLSDLGEKMAKLVPMVGPKPRPFAQFVPEGSEHGGDLREFVATEGEGARRILALAQALEGVKASESIHACGVLVSPESLVDLIPLRLHTDKKTGVQSWVTRWEGPELEDFGMLKMDILGLRNLDIARYCEDLLRESGEDIDLDAVDASDISDPRVLRTWQMLAAGTTSGVFQLESAGMTRLLVEAIGGLLRRGLAPTMADLSTIIALYRPGPMGERMHETWAAIKAGTLTSSYAQFTLDPTEQAVIAEILDETEGVIVLQEQLMFLAQSISGFGPYTKSKLQKAVSKKQMAELNKLETLFIDGGEFALPDGGVEIVPGGVSQFERPDGTTSPAFQRQTLVALWETFKASGNYLFNKAHSFAYAVLAFETAYLKANWPLQYAAGLLVRTEKVEARRTMLSELGRSGAEVLPPDLNIAGPHTFAEESRIVFGIAEVKGVSEQSAAAIVAEREHAGPFRSFADAAERLTRAGEIEDGSGTQVRPSVPAKEIAALIAAGGLDAFGPRREMTRLIGGYVAPTKTASPIPLTTEDVTVLPGLDWSPVERSARQMGVLRVALGQHPMQTQEVADLLGTWSPHTSYGSRGDGIVRRICAAGSYVESNAAVTVAGILSSWRLIERETGNFAFAVIEDGEDTIEVAIWNRVLRRIEPADLPGLGDLVVITGKVERRRRTTIVSTGDADSDAQAGDDPDAEGAVKVEEVVDELQIAADQVSTVRTATPEHGPALPPLASVQSVFEGMTAKLQGAEETKKPQRKRATKSQSEIPGVAEGQGAGRKAEAAPPAGPGPHAQAPVQAPDRAEEAAALALPADPDGSAETPMPDAPPPSLPAAAAPVAAPLEVAARTGGEPGALAAVWTAPGRDIPVQTRPESPVAPAAENPASTFGIPRGEHIAPRSAPTSSHPLLDDLSAYAALKRGGIQSS